MISFDDPAAVAAADPGAMLAAVATAATQVREAAAVSGEAGVGGLAEAGRPRAVVATGMGGSAIAAEVLAAVAGPGGSVPIVVHRGYELPSWVNANDLVMGISCSGSTEETLSAVEAAARRGCRLLTVGTGGSPLAELSAQARGIHVPIDPAGRMPRACTWLLSVPLLVAADALELAAVPGKTLEATADLLDEIAEACRPGADGNPGGALALELAGSLPMVWGTGDLAGTAAYRFACQLAENAKYPAISGTLPEANHNQVVTWDGPFGGGAPADGLRLRLVVLRDNDEHPQVARRREVSVALAEDRGIPVSEVAARGTHRLERLAGLVALTDFASVYLALALGVDPTPIGPITDLKERIAR